MDVGILESWQGCYYVLSRDEGPLTSILEKIVNKFQRINFKALLKKYCPKQQQDNSPTSNENVQIFLLSIATKLGIFLLIGDQKKPIREIVKKLVNRTVTTNILLGDMMIGLEVENFSWLQNFEKIFKLHIGILYE